MAPTDSVFLIAESREHPMQVGGLQLFTPPDGASARDVRDLFDASIETGEVATRFQKRPRRSITSLGQWGWEHDDDFDIEHHVRRNALPAPGRVLELLALCSRLHSTLLDRHRPLWEAHLIEGLDDGRYAVYYKIHHSLVDGVTAQRLLQRALSADPDVRDLPAPWCLREPRDQTVTSPPATSSPLRMALDTFGEVAGLPAALARTVGRAMRQQSASLSFAAPRSMFNVPITGARRFAAQSWPLSRFKAVAKPSGATVNDVVLAMCSGALRAYMLSLDALPDAPLIAMVPVSLHTANDSASNAVGAVMCNLGTDLDDPALRLGTVIQSMSDGKQALAAMTPLQTLAMSAIGLSPLLLPMLGLNGIGRPPFNIMISNVPGSRRPLYWNGARLDGLYPLSVPLDGQALNITVTSYAGSIAFGLTGCRRSVPHLQRLLGHLEDELTALELAVA